MTIVVPGVTVQDKGHAEGEEAPMGRKVPGACGTKCGNRQAVLDLLEEAHT